MPRAANVSRTGGRKASPETSALLSEQRPRRAPVVGVAAFGFVDRSGRGKHPPHLPPAGGHQTAEGRVFPLQCDQLVLAHHRQLRQCHSRDDGGGIDVAQGFGKPRRMSLGVGDLGRQARHEVALALFGITRFERVEMVAHASQRFLRR